VPSSWICTQQFFRAAGRQGCREGVRWGDAMCRASQVPAPPQPWAQGGWHSPHTVRGAVWQQLHSLSLSRPANCFCWLIHCSHSSRAAGSNRQRLSASEMGEGPPPAGSSAPGGGGGTCVVPCGRRDGSWCPTLLCCTWAPSSSWQHDQTAAVRSAALRCAW
jgi:hypothetical protein